MVKVVYLTPIDVKYKVADMPKQEVIELHSQGIGHKLWSAPEAASMLLTIDDIIAAGKSKTPAEPPGGGNGGMKAMAAVWVWNRISLVIKSHIRLSFLLVRVETSIHRFDLV
jgi:hypothetical protein